MDIPTDHLRVLVAEGATERGIAEELGVTHVTVRRWLARAGLRTRRATRLDATRAALASGASTTTGTCEVHGSVTFVSRAGGMRCGRCRADAVVRRRRRMKAILVAEAGGACAECGYDRSLAALHFHHLDPTTKSFAVAGRGVTRSLDAARAEAAKCKLLCANCHAEVEAGDRELR